MRISTYAPVAAARYSLNKFPIWIEEVVKPTYDESTEVEAIPKGMIAVVPPKSNRIDPWEYDRELYEKRK